MRVFVSIVAGLCALGLWAAAILLGLSGMTHFQPEAATEDIADRGVARVVDCESDGPVTLYGFGHWEICRADVVWENGRTERATAAPGQLTIDDRGRGVPVVGRNVVGNTRGPRTLKLYRADFEPSAMFGIGSVLGGLGVGGVLALGVFANLRGRRIRATPE